ncbi:MAG: outer membrane protein assembly factor BamE [Pseudomonadota bacterium]|nr:outer membrane protein assembly factor BamE [Pseudomonadota bacterium]
MFAASRMGSLQRALLCAGAIVFSAALGGCSPQIDRHGHVFSEVDLQLIQPGMNKEQVRQMLGSPDTTSAIGGDAFYYISSVRETRPMGRPQVVDRKIVAIYFDRNEVVNDVGNYGIKDGKVFAFAKGETESYGKKLNAVQQIFGNIQNRQQVYQPRDTPGSGNRP